MIKLKRLRAVHETATKIMGIMEQKFVEEVHLFCSRLELEEFIRRFQKAFIREFPNLANLPTASAETATDNYDLSSEAAGRHGYKNRQNYVVKQEFNYMVREKGSRPCEEDLDLLSDRVFEVVKGSCKRKRRRPPLLQLSRL